MAPRRREFAITVMSCLARDCCLLDGFCEISDPVRLVRAIGLLCRMLVIMSLISLGFGAPAMAAGGPPDCMAMMHRPTRRIYLI